MLKSATLDEYHPDTRWNDQPGADQQDQRHARIWADWLPRSLPGESACQSTAWSQAHCQDWTMEPSDLKQTAWFFKAQFGAQGAEPQWDTGCHAVHTEQQNTSWCRGSSPVGMTPRPRCRRHRTRPDHRRQNRIGTALAPGPPRFGWGTVGPSLVWILRCRTSVKQRAWVARACPQSVPHKPRTVN